MTRLTFQFFFSLDGDCHSLKRDHTHRSSIFFLLNNINERYCKGTTLWDAPIFPLNSGTWKFIASLRTEAANNMTQDAETGQWNWIVFSSAWNAVRNVSPPFEFHSIVWFTESLATVLKFLLFAKGFQKQDAY